MRILYLHQYFAMPQMGGGIRSYEMARRLAADGHEVHLLTTDRDARRLSCRWRVERIEGFTVHWLPVPYRNSMGFASRIAAFLAFAAMAGPKAVLVGGDVVIATSTPLTIAIPGIFAKLILRRPMIFEVRDLWPSVPIAMGALRNPVLIGMSKWLEALSYHQASRIIVLSKDMAEGVLSTGYPRERVTVIPNGSDREIFDVDPAVGAAFRDDEAWLASKPLVLYAGSFGKVNGVAYMVRLAAAVHDLDPDVQFLAIGSGAEKRAVSDLAAVMGVLNTNLRILPPVSKQRLAEIMSAASVVASWVIPVAALEANSANKIFDGFAAGRPVAINYGGWQADLLEGSGAGIRLAAHDVSRAATDLVSYLSSPERLAKARERSAELGRTLFDRDRLFRQFSDVVCDQSEHGARGMRAGPVAGDGLSQME
jgi:glycosyltransferase involved in cell wall biosynthesis